LLRIVLFEPLDLLDEPPDLYTFFDVPVFDRTPADFLLRDVLNGFKRLLSEAELFDFLRIRIFEFFTIAPELSEAWEDFFFDPNPRTGPPVVVASVVFFPDLRDNVFVEPLPDAIARGLYFLLILASG